MQLLEGGWIYSATDLVARMECDHRTALDLALKQGILPVEVVPAVAEGMAMLAGKHGDLHEQRVLGILRTRYAQVVEIDQPRNTREALRQAAADTSAALDAGVDVVHGQVEPGLAHHHAGRQWRRLGLKRARCGGNSRAERQTPGCNLHRDFP